MSLFIYIYHFINNKIRKFANLIFFKFKVEHNFDKTSESVVQVSNFCFTFTRRKMFL